MPKKYSRGQRKAHARLMRKQEEEVETGKLTDESWPVDSISEPFRERKDGPEFVMINWASTKEPLTAIAHFPASEINSANIQMMKYMKYWRKKSKEIKLLSKICSIKNNKIINKN